MHRPLKKSWMTVVTLIMCLQPLRAEKVVIDYWDKWAGAPGAAMQDIVDDFNASQDRIEVHYSAISQLEIKVMLAIAGRKPPDVAGLWASRMATYVENNALLPLDDRVKSVGLKQEDYLPSVWELCRYRGHLWALPTTPYCLALCWNKRLFREAGLDPDRGPRTIAELEEYNTKLTHLNPDGKSYRTFGLYPTEVSGAGAARYVTWFGGRFWDGESRITATDEGNRRTLEWLESYPKRFGAHQISLFMESSSASASSVTLDPFMQGRVAMELIGPWVSDQIRKYTTGDFELGVAPFPTESGKGPPVTRVDSDILTIPAGARHVPEALEFIRYVNRQDVIEKFCISHCQFSPLVKVSDAFWKNHPNPYIKTFYDLAQSPGAQLVPRMTIWNEYENEIDQNFTEVWALRATPQEALQRIQDRMQPKLDRSVDRWNNLSGKLEKIWSEEENKP